MKLSIIIPGIRTNRWEEVHDSIHNSTTKPFEVIFVGPYALPASLQTLKNVKYVKDFGSPVRCSNIGLSLCEGDLMTWDADDGNFFGHGCLDTVIDFFDALPSDPKNVLVCKYQEGSRVTQPDSYYKIDNAYPLVDNVKGKDWWIMNLVVTKTKYFMDLGGWDCRFQTLAFAHADMSIRAHQDNALITMYNEAFVFCQHGHTDHKPIEDAHFTDDMPLYQAIHNDPSTINRKVDITNWRNAPSVWTRRFG